MTSLRYSQDVTGFLRTPEDALLGALVRTVSKTGVEAHRATQIKAWRSQIQILKEQLCAQRFQSWHLALEYEIPRRWKRPDVILLADGLVFVVEFKVGAPSFDSASKWQVEDYALNLRDFHAESRGRTIVPILCATEAPSAGDQPILVRGEETRVGTLLCANKLDLGIVLGRAYDDLHQVVVSPIVPQDWLDSHYMPTPTIVEAAIRLYDNHGVREISHRHAYNLQETTDMLVGAVKAAESNSQRTVCFVTGIPGAGKTLTGLDVVHDPNIRGGSTPGGIFLSGNGPLVRIVRAALVDSRTKAGWNKRACEHKVSTFIQNVHQFLRHHLDHDDLVPTEHVVVFDEAQRAWDAAQMDKKSKIPFSEADLLLEVMERLPEWCVVIALVGCGQEIFSGEAGLEEWGRALSKRPTHWHAIVSQEALEGGSGVGGHSLFGEQVPQNITLRVEPYAHLRVNVRSHRAGRLAAWVDRILSFNWSGAIEAVPNKDEFPIVISRSLTAVRRWLTSRGLGDPNLRTGLVASSGDERLRAYGLEVSSGFRRRYPYEKWFLSDRDDCRSSVRHEVAATEFECQGLELDWVGVCWGSDLTPRTDALCWEHRRFRGTKWQQVHQKAERAFIENRYRVLLTRARLGMALWVPAGSAKDDTRDPLRLDKLFEYLCEAGARVLEE